MKLLITIFFTLLLGFAGSSYVKWWRSAAEQGDVDAQYNLGIMYNNGQGVPENKAEAVNWYRLAAEQGNAPAR